MMHRDGFEMMVDSFKPLEVFDYYDGPKFYSCQDSVAQLYLVYWVDEFDSKSQWLYIRISQDRYGALKRGDIPIAVALSQPEQGYGFLVVTSGSKTIQVTQIEKDQISIDWMPDAVDRLQLSHVSLPSNLNKAVDLASKVNRHVLDVAFEKTNNTYEMAAGKFARLLESCQNTLFALSCPAGVDVRRVPEAVKFNSELMVTGLFASSFGVRLQTKGVDFFSSDGTAIALATLTSLIDSINSPEVLSNQLHELNVLTRSRFKHFLSVMIDAQVSVKANWGAPNGSDYYAKASFSEITRALNTLNLSEASTKQTVNRFVKLVGVDVNTDFFAIVLDDGGIIKGKLSKTLVNRHFEVPSFINATIEEASVIDPLTDREKWTYILLDVNPV